MKDDFANWFLSYGWAILVILVVAGALFYYGVFKFPEKFNPELHECTLFEYAKDTCRESAPQNYNGDFDYSQKTIFNETHSWCTYIASVNMPEHLGVTIQAIKERKCVSWQPKTECGRGNPDYEIKNNGGYFNYGFVNELGGRNEFIANYNRRYESKLVRIWDSTRFDGVEFEYCQKKEEMRQSKQPEKCFRNITNPDWIDACCAKSPLKQYDDITLSFNDSINTSYSLHLETTSMSHPILCLEGLNASEYKEVIIGEHRIDAEKCAKTPQKILDEISCTPKSSPPIEEEREVVMETYCQNNPSDFEKCKCIRNETKGYARLFNWLVRCRSDRMGFVNFTFTNDDLLFNPTFHKTWTCQSPQLVFAYVENVNSCVKAVPKTEPNLIETNMITEIREGKSNYEVQIIPCECCKTNTCKNETTEELYERQCGYAYADYINRSVSESERARAKEFLMGMCNGVVSK